MEQRLRKGVQATELLLNFFTVFCLETALDAGFGLKTPAAFLWLPFFCPVLFWALRCRAKYLWLFLAVHPAAVALLVWAGGFAPVPLLWKAGFGAVGTVYALYSIRLRLSGRTGEGELPLALAAALTAAAFLVCGYQQKEAGCARILGCFFVWLPLFLLKRYVENYLSYVELGRRSAGVLPDRSIFRTGLAGAGLFAGISALLLALCAATPLSERLTLAAAWLGRGLLWLLAHFLMLFSGGEEGEISAPQTAGGTPDFSGLGEAQETPFWMEVLQQLLLGAVTLALVAGLFAGAVLLVRWMLRSFYAGANRQVPPESSGGQERLERLERRPRKRRSLPFLGGTPAERVRRSFARAVEGCVEAGQRDRAMTARQLAAAGRQSSLSDPSAETDWERLTELYEQARYGREETDRSRAREAGRLAGLLRAARSRRGQDSGVDWETHIL